MFGVFVLLYDSFMISKDLIKNKHINENLRSQARVNGYMYYQDMNNKYRLTEDNREIIIRNNYIIDKITGKIVGNKKTNSIEYKEESLENIELRNVGIKNIAKELNYKYCEQYSSDNVSIYIRISDELKCYLSNVYQSKNIKNKKYKFLHGYYECKYDFFIRPIKLGFNLSENDSYTLYMYDLYLKMIEYNNILLSTCHDLEYVEKYNIPIIPVDKSEFIHIYNNDETYHIKGE